ncbi:hypothetical protein COS93_01160 [bacterium (Candidatus Gribaldobacteria) CG07_land_8_20_14_0_80_33_18]|uniref:SCP domain-containing protein n=1 Tax=bacterium (Candidatus Gribaldobacteria) CG07_land_8_20_14_0_80_33_18 TaxID=2014272 RepID=A0A2M6Z3I8_9BACT|nr:MAG: hypothetical protein COU04_02280 [bacterium (Candidatus Gribaldobacteria) CG10_big_fil_rev_8_21_14_0_10_33_41]PIU46973.1 MAG: hypothetical protein COS93_01160 [bacterium (Candidatus Gribaldobacteria) CG07_land_8_20_14_0_80_33_18]PJA01337.1 MAG: hypothetical protein COX75_00085 [bacterium (Candidatus Gribaldobacteria) CG_4_10_14_0_2_um_filter_33_15]PJB09081.1 MAG: hypothetical protein CO122_00040 [bacterium (Candidatus Gribaldobacteria) CG_4_9_14_3_um_filter_33_9]
MKKFVLQLQRIFIPCKENNYRPKFLDSKFLIYYFIFLFILKFISFSSLFILPKSVYFADITKTRLVELTNKTRETLGLQSLKVNPLLEKAAELKAQDMFSKGYFSHYSPTGISPWYWIKLADYNYRSAGENLAIGFLDSNEVVNAWEDSPSHRENILNSNYSEIGIAVVKGEFLGNKTYVVVQMFASPKIKQETIFEEEKTTTSQTITGTTITLESTTSSTTSSEIAGISSLPEENINKDLKFNFYKFLAIDYDDLLRKIIFYSLIIIAAALIINIFVKFNIQYPDLIIKAVAVIILLCVFNYFDKFSMLQLISHNFMI